MLPSMCSRLTYADNEEYFQSLHLQRDKKCYIDWCNEYIKDRWIISCLGEEYAEVLYSLRCDIVHAGCADIYSDKKKSISIFRR